ncbi:hypothetical protein BDY24DRAFT_437988 [Mrakia frigida]|uniref:uncharacterized protein n=1 Tax=Mrakia frigida TaxID=29902 RepID=UPI003FCC1D64
MPNQLLEELEIPTTKEKMVRLSSFFSLLSFPLHFLQDLLTLQITQSHHNADTICPSIFQNHTPRIQSLRSVVPPSPPLLDSPSSSSYRTPLSQPSLLESPASQELSISQLATAVHHLSTTVGRLSSENEAQSRKLAQFASTVARLSSENEELKRRSEEQGRTIQEISTASLPNGHWSWDAGKGGMGSYSWSRNLMKYKPNQHQPTNLSEPPPSLATLPLELVDAIVSLLPRTDVLRLCGVSFMLLERASIHIYATRTVAMTSREAASFVLSRLKEPFSLENRVTPLLIPSRLSLTYRSFKSKHLTHLSRVGRHLPSLPIDLLCLERDPKSPQFSIERWSPLLWFLNPRHLHYGSNEGDQDGTPPTVSHVHRHSVAVATRWNRLAVFVAKGAHSVPLLVDSEEFAFCEVMRATGEIRAMGLLRVFVNERQSKLEIVEEREIEGFLKILPVLDPSLSSRSFVVALLAHSSGDFMTVHTLD